MTSTILIVVLIAVPLGFLVGHLFLNNRSGGRRVATPEIVERQDVSIEPSVADSRTAEARSTITYAPSTEAMAGKIERLRSERNALREQVAGLERTTEDLGAQIEGGVAQLAASARQVEKAEKISRSAGARLVEALSERDEAVERLHAEKSSHAETHRSLEGAETYLQLLVGHLDETGGAIGEISQNELVAQVAELRETVGRLDQQMHPNVPNQIPAGRR